MIWTLGHVVIKLAMLTIVFMGVIAVLTTIGMAIRWWVRQVANFWHEVLG